MEKMGVEEDLEHRKGDPIPRPREILRIDFEVPESALPCQGEPKPMGRTGNPAKFLKNPRMLDPIIFVLVAARFCSSASALASITVSLVLSSLNFLLNLVL